MEEEVEYEPAARLSSPRKLFEVPNHMFDRDYLPGNRVFAVVGDGERFIVPRVIQDVKRASRGIVVVQNWVTEFLESP
jgi:hypothetical protein